MVPGLKPRLLAAASVASILTAVAWYTADAIATDLATPRDLQDSEYVGSVSCRRCHAGNYASWHKTYHRTMTQEADDSTVLGRFDGATLDYLGVRARMFRGDAGAFLISFSRGGGAERWQATVVRTVGSHRYQQYLARDADIYYRLPVAWHVAEQRWFHMNAAFLTSDPLTAPGEPVSRADYDRHVTRWNDNCIFCHNVHPNPGLDPESGTFDSSVAELGVACESCHGPASEHLRSNASPLRRYALHLFGSRDSTITNPDRLDHHRSAQVCGRCHGQRITDDISLFKRFGDNFVPGEELERYSRPLTRHTKLAGKSGIFAARFWNDGTPRLTAYEYQGLLLSPCNTDERFDCESCHSMHSGAPAGQVRPGKEEHRACTGCHQELAEDRARADHSRHRATGSGSRCGGCHMPQLVYGLVGIRISHRIESPNPSSAAELGRPDACTLCHVDRSRQWAIERTAALWQARAGPGERVAEAARHPEMTRMLLGGDPIERAVAAHALGDPRSHAGPEHEAVRLGLLFDAMALDDYPAVRSIAWRSLRARVALGHGLRLDPAAFEATERPDRRRQRIAALLERLPGNAVEPADKGVVVALRALAAQEAIDIGE